MANIKDVARLAGVSHGTVSNVLNGGSHVSPAKAKRVLEAVRKLGYVPTAAARSLKLNRSMNIAVILPQIKDSHYSAMFEGMERFFSDKEYHTQLMTSSENPKKEMDILSLALQQRVDGIILVSCRPDTIDRNLQELNVQTPMVCLERDAGKGLNFVGCNNTDSMESFVSGLISDGYSEIAMICGPLEFSTESEYLEGYRQALQHHNRSFSDDHVIITATNKESSFRGAVELFQSSFIPEIVICTSTELAKGAEKALEFLHSFLSIDPKIVAISDASWVKPDHGSYYQFLKPSCELGEQAATLLLQNIEDPAFFEPKKIILENIVKMKATVFPEPVVLLPKRSLKIAMLEGTASRALLSISKEFESKSDITVEIEQFSYDLLYDQLTNESSSTAYDILQIDLPWMEDIISRGTLLSLDSYINTHKRLRDKLVPGALESYALFNGSIYAIPFIFGTQLLFYRKDLFEDPNLQNQFFSIYHSKLVPPRNWNEYNAIAEFFTRSINSDSPVRYGTTLGGQNSSGAVCEVLPRIWSFGGTIFDSEGNILIDQEEAVKGLASYQKSFDYAPPEASEQWWNEQVEIFAHGESAMMVLFVAHATAISDRHHLKTVGRIGYEIVPGGKPLLGGWSLGIQSESRLKDKAFEFLNWISREENAIPHMILGGANPSIHLYQSSELRSIYPWLEKSLESFSLCRKRSIPRNYFPDLSERQFEKILGQQVHDCITGKIDAESAFSRAKEQLQCFSIKKMQTRP